MVQLPEIVKQYIKAKVLLTECQQQHFKQLCHTCHEYAGCKVYGSYVLAWMNLQEASKNENEEDVCSWKYDDLYDCYNTSCGNSFCLMYGTPSESGMKYCLFCGKVLRQ